MIMTTPSSDAPVPDDDRLVAEALRDNPVLESLGEADLQEFIAHLDRIDFEPGESVIREGQLDQSTYFVLHGEASIVRGGVKLGTLKRGDHFGELELIAARARAASIVSVTRLSLARLGHDRYQALSGQNPQLALKLLQTFLHGVADRLLEMTESFGRLLGERASPRRITIQVRAGGTVTPARMGIRIHELLPRVVDGHPVVAGLVDRKAASLTTRPISSSDVEPAMPNRYAMP